MTALEVEEFVACSARMRVLDLRSRAAYVKGHIPGAESVSMDELDRLPAELRFCWYSTSVRLEEPTLQALRRDRPHLGGGYEAYRSAVPGVLGSVQRLVVLTGLTGSGKTEVLRELRRSGHQVVDLERLAGHSGSAFGGLRASGQPTSEQFENLIAEVCRHSDERRWTFIEWKGKRIGGAEVPRALMARMSEGLTVHLETPRPARVERILTEYGDADVTLLRQAILQIVPALGEVRGARALRALEANNRRAVIAEMLSYYDDAYVESAPRQPAVVIQSTLGKRLVPRLLERLNCGLDWAR